MYTVLSQVSAHGCSTRTLIFHHTGHLPSVLGTYSVQQLKEAGSIIMGVVFARYAHVRICTLYVIVIDQFPRFVCSIEDESRGQIPRDECFYTAYKARD